MIFRIILILLLVISLMGCTSIESKYKDNLDFSDSKVYKKWIQEDEPRQDLFCGWDNNPWCNL